MFNTIDYIKKLEGVGVRRDQAEIHAQTVFEFMNNNLATKDDLALMKNELKAEIAALRTEMNYKFELYEARIISRLNRNMAVGFTISTTIATTIIGFLIKS